MSNYKNIDEYFASYNGEVLERLRLIRETIQKHAPNAVEKISWGMPTFYLKENLVHFFAHKNHIGFYPGATCIFSFSNELDKLGYKYSKGVIKFPHSKDIPYDLIADIVLFRLNDVNKKFEV